MSVRLALVVACAAIPLAACADRLAPPPRATPGPQTVATLDRLGHHPCNDAVAAVPAGLGVRGETVSAVTHDVRRDLETDRV